ncbi:MAG: hypothetical protein M9913_06935 [Bryobacteraceae bacterium]|nr:hypothetical protein [Solibacteraceae bacterium]MCO5350619.1 hypothetical protein [Bryobacteraceae bacterium]
MTELVHSEVFKHILKAIDEAERTRKGFGNWKKVRNHIRNARRAAGGGSIPAVRRRTDQWSVDMDAVERDLADAKIAAIAWDREGNPQPSESHTLLVQAIRRARMGLPPRED